MNVVTPSEARCRRCGMRLARTRGEAWCLACGPVERPVVSLEEARREVEEPLAGKTVKRAPVLRVGVGTRYGDGCDVAPRCLECPLPECKFVEQPGDRREGKAMVVEASAPGGVVLDSKALGEQCVRAMRAVALRVGRLDQERAGLLEELGKLAAVAGFCEVEVPEEVAGLLPARKGPAKGSAPSAGGAFACTWCPRTFGTFVAQRVHETKAHDAGNNAGRQKGV